MMKINFKNLKINKLNPKTDFEKKVVFFLRNWFSDTKEIKIQTSGSTGTPKILYIEKEKMQHSANMTIQFLGLRTQDTALLCLPIDYISGKMMLVRAMEQSMQIHLCTPHLSPLTSITETIDFCAMTPLQVEHSLDKIHLIQKLIIGGASVSESLKDKIHATLHKTASTNNRKIFETYGMSETLSHIALKEIFPRREEYFKALNNVEISQDNRGCLVIYAPHLHTEKLYTNDIVTLLDNHTFKFLGRIDNVINSGGAKIFPEELELLVKKEVPHEVVFIGCKDPVLSERLTLVIEAKETDTLKETIRSIDFKKSFHRPKSIIFIDKIPRTENGKVNRLALKTFYENK